MKPTDEMLAQKNGTDKFLKQIRKYTDDVIVAGGFARDWICRTKYNLDVEPHDVDIYVKANPSLMKWLQDMDSKSICNEETSRYEGLNNLKKVYRFETQFPTESSDELFQNMYEVEFQVIVLDTELGMSDYVNKYFDLSICMATYDGKDFKELEPFTKTMETKVITFNDDLGFDETEYGFRKHVAKITCRFARHNFKYEGYNPKFDGYRFNCKLINRSDLTDYMIDDKKWLYRTKKYYYYDEGRR